jgi:hypothetical protein
MKAALSVLKAQHETAPASHYLPSRSRALAEHYLMNWSSLPMIAGSERETCSVGQMMFLKLVLPQARLVG